MSSNTRPTKYYLKLTHVGLGPLKNLTNYLLPLVWSFGKDKQSLKMGKSIPSNQTSDVSNILSEKMLNIFVLHDAACWLHVHLN